jgi:hypothetical protein
MRDPSNLLFDLVVLQRGDRRAAFSISDAVRGVFHRGGRRR